MERDTILRSGSPVSIDLWKSLEKIISAINDCNFVSNDIYNHWIITDDLRDLRKALKTHNNMTPLEFIKMYEDTSVVINNIDDLKILMLINEVVESIIYLVDNDAELNKYIRMIENVGGKEDILL